MARELGCPPPYWDNDLLCYPKVRRRILTCTYIQPQNVPNGNLCLCGRFVNTGENGQDEKWCKEMEEQVWFLLPVELLKQSFAAAKQIILTTHCCFFFFPLELHHMPRRWYGYRKLNINTLPAWVTIERNTTKNTQWGCPWASHRSTWERQLPSHCVSAQGTDRRTPTSPGDRQAYPHRYPFYLPQKTPRRTLP